MIDTEGVEYIVQREHFKLKYEGDNEISLDVLNQTLNAINELTKLAVDNKFRYEYRISACEKGSFVLDIFSIAHVASNLLTIDNILYIKNSLSTIKEWLEIKKHLKNSPPKKVEKVGGGVSITNTSGDVYYSSLEGAKILCNSNINNLVMNIACNLSNGERKGFKLIDDGGDNVISISEKDYPALSSEADIMPKSKTKKETAKKILLIVIKPDLYGDSQWELFYNKRIKVKIEDKDWKRQIENHQVSFTKGTQLRADLRIEIELDENLMPIEDTDKYFIEKVYGIIQPEVTESDQTTFES